MLSQSAVTALQKVISVCTTRLTTTADIESVIVLLSRGGLSAAGLIQILGISQSAIPTLQKLSALAQPGLKMLIWNLSLFFKGRAICCYSTALHKV